VAVKGKNWEIHKPKFRTGNQLMKYHEQCEFDQRKPGVQQKKCGFYEQKGGFFSQSAGISATMMKI
jgi:hypothetical protein